MLAAVLHFYSGQPLQNLSGVDTKRVLARRDNLHNHRSLRKAEAEPRSCLNAPGLIVRLSHVCLPHCLSAKPPHEVKVTVRVT